MYTEAMEMDYAAVASGPASTIIEHLREINFLPMQMQLVSLTDATESIEMCTALSFLLPGPRQYKGMRQSGLLSFHYEPNEIVLFKSKPQDVNSANIILLLGVPIQQGMTTQQQYRGKIIKESLPQHPLVKHLLERNRFLFAFHPFSIILC